MTEFLLDDICLKITDGSHFSPKEKKEGYKMLSSKDMRTYDFDYSNVKLISKEDYDKLVRQDCKPLKNDILIIKDGNSYLRNVFVIEEEREQVILSSIAVLRPNTEKVIPEYLCYILRDKKFKKNVADNFLSGSAIPRIVLKDFKRIKVSLPEILVQKEIVNIIKKIDDKIRLNEKLNVNLYSVIETLYTGIKEYTNVKLEELCEYCPDRVEISNITNENYISTENMLLDKKGSVEASSIPDTKKATGYKKGDTLVSNIRPYFKKIKYAMGGGGCSNDVLCFRSKNEVYSKLIFSALYQDEFFDYVMAGSKGTKMPRGDKQQIMQYLIKVPDKETLLDTNSQLSSILDGIDNLRKQNKKWIELRDTLLPKLMSGEIDLSEMDLDI